MIEAVEAKAHEQAARAGTDAALGALSAACAEADAHPVNHELRRALKERDLKAWAHGCGTLSSLEQDREAWKEAWVLLKALREAVPGLARSLFEQPEDATWDERLRRFEDAWGWATADRWLAAKDDEGTYRGLVRESHDLQRTIGRITGELAAERAWSQFLGRLTPREKESLEAWQLAVKQIGKGTGKYAEKHRAEARKYMEGCVHSIPAWIVPRYRVAEVLEPEPELFDVVIVDEASQTGIDGLFLYYLGRQTVVVGDHHQISPAGVGVHGGAIIELQRRFLSDIPFPAALEPDSSLYNHAKIRYQSRLVLQEHFRCVPEIIQFSNDLCYAPSGTALIPLRTYPPSRLRPVVTRFVKDGYQEGTASSAVNRPEAARLAAQLSACLRDPRYQGKTLGVISLLGASQARLIQHLLTQVVGPEVMEKRDLVCGDAYAFQGDERDIVFLSMVSAPNARIGALTKSDALQRFNVAASRAKDQLWLFHSVQPEDLSAQCVRRRLLEYCFNLHRETPAEEDRFESQLEQDVCERIRARGFRVRTQVESGDQTSHRYRIDLVIEGIESRLAVECDGDAWHGPEQYEADMGRQRQLERAGWRFLHVRGGNFYRNPDEALQLLWQELERLQIRPRIGGDAEPDVADAEPELADAGAIQGIADFLGGTDYDKQGRVSVEDQAVPAPTADRFRAHGEVQDLVRAQSELKDRLPTRVLGRRQRRVAGERQESSPDAKKRSTGRSKGRQEKGADSYAEADFLRDREYLEQIPAAELLRLSHWAKLHDKLEGWQRGVLYSVGRNKKAGWESSDRQVRRAAEAHRAAMDQGFEAEEAKSETISSLVAARGARLSENEQDLIRRLLERVADSTGHAVTDLLTGGPSDAVDRARSLAAYVLTLRSGLSAGTMREVLGFEGENAIEEAVREVERLKQQDPSFGALVTDCLVERTS